MPELISVEGDIVAISPRQSWKPTKTLVGENSRLKKHKKNDMEKRVK